MTQIDIRFESRYGKNNRRPRWVGRFRSLSGVLFILASVNILISCNPPNGAIQNGILTSTPTPSFTPELSATPASNTPACFQQPGRIVEELLSSQLLPRELQVSIYLPPCYDEERAQAYPVLYLFHGLGDSDEQWLRLGLIELADERLMNRLSDPFLIVMPWERSGQEMETAALEVLIPFIETTYHVRTDREGRALGGISRGGGWALAIVAQAPQEFGAIGLHSTGILNSIAYLQLKLLEPWSLDQPRIWIDVGERDTLAPRAQELLDLFDRLELEYTWHLYPGGHNDSYWASHMDEYLDWYVQEWE